MNLWHILGRGDNGWGEIVGFVILMIVWGLAALGQAANKQKKKQQGESQRLREVRQRIDAEQQQAARAPRRINPNIARRQPAVLTPPANYGRAPVMRPAPVRRMPPPIPPARRAPPRRAATRTVAPTPVTPVTRITAPTVQAKQPVAQTQMGSGEEKPKRLSPTGATAPSIATWLQPATLRTQFILTEIFQPPISLREGMSSAPWQG